MFADFEDIVNEQLIEESEEWLADVLSEEDLYAIYEAEEEKEKKQGTLSRAAGAVKSAAGTAAGGLKKGAQATWSGVKKGAGATGRGLKTAGSYYATGLKGGPDVSKAQKYATRGATAAVGATALGVGAYKLAQRMKKRKQCRAQFPNDPEKYKACVKG